MINAGSFKARATGPLVVGESSVKKTPCVTVTLRLEDGPDAGSLIEWVGWLGEKSKARTAESLALMGFDGTDPSTVTRQEVVAVIDHETNVSETTGKSFTEARVKWINDPARGGTKFSTVEPAKQAAMLADMRGLVLSAKKAQSGGEFPPASAATKPKF